MSSSSTMRSTKMSMQRKKSCKVCFDAGKPESESSTHNVKDKQGKVVCPTLLSVKCRFCSKNGHTVKYCEVLKAKTRQDEANNNRMMGEANKRKVAFVADTKPANMFARLCCESDDDEEGEVRDREEFPKLNENANKASATATAKAQDSRMTYAQTLSQTQTQTQTQTIAPLPIPVLVRATNAPVKSQPKRWADYSSDEEDSDIEDIYELGVAGF